ncbi:MAG: hypothetical protein HY695_11270 [Deltaproteobacteria bacterium]|nr:hypothetical protein [Deltaproteobacteria bacterium]
MNGKPSIIEVISERVLLRKTGKEYAGLCPFHAEKTPSFTVNEDKGVFYCHGCGAGGDVIRFIEMIDEVPFKEAISRLRLDDRARPWRKPEKSPERAIAERIAAWAADFSLVVAARLRELGQQIRLAGEYSEHSYGRQWEILETLHEDLTNPQFLPELWRHHSILEEIVNA